MEKPNGLSWEHKKNEQGVDMAIINRQSLVDFMLYAEYLQQELEKAKEQIVKLNEENTNKEIEMERLKRT